MATLFVGNPKEEARAGRRRDQLLALNMITDAASDMSRMIFEHKMAVERDKLREAEILVEMADSVGWDAMGEKSLDRLEDSINLTFPRDVSGKRILPENPRLFIDKEKMRMIQMHPEKANVILGLEAPAPSAVQVKIDDVDREFKRTEAELDRDTDLQKAYIQAGATTDAARIAAGARSREEASRPENRMTNFVLQNGSLRQMSPEKAARRGLEFLTRGDVEFIQKFNTNELKAIETDVNITNTRKQTEHVAAQIAKLTESNPETRQLYEIASEMRKAGDEAGAAEITAALADSVINKDRTVRESLEKIRNQPGFLGKMLDYIQGYRATALRSAEADVTEQRQMPVEQRGSTTRTTPRGRPITVHKRTPGAQ